MTLGERLQLLRKSCDLSQKELAAHLKYTVSTISNYEQDIHFPDLHTLCKLADYYHVSTDYLLGRTEYVRPMETLRNRLVQRYSEIRLINTVLGLNGKNIVSLMDYIDLLERRDRINRKWHLEQRRKEEKKQAKAQKEFRNARKER
jgi:transcriptional regulator with XRE-family HTH domain